MTTPTVTIGIFAAKTRFSEMVEKVSRGMSYIITHRNRPVARVVPFKDESAIRRKRAVADILKRREHCSLNGLDFKTLRDEGRP